MPILLVSGERTSKDDKVEGLEAGTTDYICKPCYKRELRPPQRCYEGEPRPRSRDRPSLRSTIPNSAFNSNSWRPGLDDVKTTSAEFNLLTAFLGAPRTFRGSVFWREAACTSNRTWRRLSVRERCRLRTDATAETFTYHPYSFTAARRAPRIQTH